jgi:hypothetical protein
MNAASERPARRTQWVEGIMDKKQIFSLWYVVVALVVLVTLQEFIGGNHTQTLSVTAAAPAGFVSILPRFGGASLLLLMPLILWMFLLATDAGIAWMDPQNAVARYAYGATGAVLVFALGRVAKSRASRTARATNGAGAGERPSTNRQARRPKTGVARAVIRKARFGRSRSERPSASGTDATQAGVHERSVEQTMYF